SVLDGEFEVEVGGVVQQAKAGESLRYRCDRPHSVRCIGNAPGRATMVCILKAAVMD
ncbi:MAG: cupin domain-containing protein, partial [Pseudomonadota bacterium]|nr:cupin domain-containing protein [Pseudomonadota bacterium]